MQEFVVAAGAGIVMIGLIYAKGVDLASAACSNKAASFEVHEYHLLGGCMVQHNGRWLPLDNIRSFDSLSQDDSFVASMARTHL